MNVYLDLTQEFNEGRLRAVICSGQAVVLHRLAVMSKDGDWILREDEEATAHVLAVLAGRGARYRFGAPLDIAWLRGGWSSHLEFEQGALRVRTDFFTRPPRIDRADLEALWAEQEGRDPPFVGARILAEMKKTNREKDYPVIGELARRMPEARDRLRYSRSARDLVRLAHRHPALVRELSEERPVLGRIGEGRESLEEGLDAERRAMIHANERRLERFRRAAREWEALWPEVSRRCAGLPLHEAHPVLVESARGVLPFRVTADAQGTGDV